MLVTPATRVRPAETHVLLADLLYHRHHYGDSVRRFLNTSGHDRTTAFELLEYAADLLHERIVEDARYHGYTVDEQIDLQRREMYQLAYEETEV